MKRLVFSFFVLFLNLQNKSVIACAVCFGDPNSKMTQGMNGAIFVLLGFIGFLLVSFGVFFLNFRSRSKKFQKVTKSPVNTETLQEGYN
ncbi:hypothetical protein CMK13_08875 [Candidatus Poribacteria bacterium]|nr:hypothetical protein [Candidatus Poribacteria bacterium]OUT62223.1 MAG: hypothetical protein CBB75_08345 [bacterium TMED15]